MAGDWIPMRVDLDNDPAVVGMARILKVSELQVVGYVWKAWSIASSQSASGTLEHYDATKLDRAVHKRGFAAAMETVGWLTITATGLAIPDFETWLGNASKKRFKEFIKKKKQRYPPLEGTKTPWAGEIVPSPILSSPVISSLGVVEGVGTEGGSPPAWFAAWCSRHALRFPDFFRWPECPDEMADWWSTLQTFSESELENTSLWLSELPEEKKPKRRQEHRAAIKRRAIEARRIAGNGHRPNNPDLPFVE